MEIYDFNWERIYLNNKTLWVQELVYQKLISFGVFNIRHYT